VASVKEGDTLQIPFYNQDKAKRGVKAIKGKTSVKPGEWKEYTVSEWYGGTPVEDRNEECVKWELYLLQPGKAPQKVLEKECGSFCFMEKAVGNRFKVVGYLYEPELDNNSALTVTVVPTQKREIQSVVLKDTQFNPISGPLSYGQKINVYVSTTGMGGEYIHVCLWEDDAKGAGHSPQNEHNLAAEVITRVSGKGIASCTFLLKPDFAKMANAYMATGDKSEGSQHEYYVTAYADDGTQEAASNNINVNNPDYQPVRPQPVTPQLRQQKIKEHLAERKAPKKNATIPVFEKRVAVKQKAASQPAPAPKPVPAPIPARLVSATRSASAAPATQAAVSDVLITDGNGQPITDTFTGSQIRVYILSTGLKGKKVKMSLYDQDITTNELVLERHINLSSDRHIEQIDLSKIAKSVGDDWLEGSEQELFIKIEVPQLTGIIESQTIDVDVKSFKPDPPDGVSLAKVGEADVEKEKFDKVKEKAEEAVIYITSEIATAIEVDKKGNIISYPDYGAYNGQEEYKEGDTIYCKKISSTRSAFPTFKAYIYRGNVVGEAVKKLKQDLKFKTHENAEPTVLEVARHSGKNNKNYGDSGPVPPNTIDKLHGLRYKKATNNDNKTSYRYRIVDCISSNFKETNDFKQEYDTGSMTLGKRSSISIDPWRSSSLIGCIGVRSDKGENHPSVKDTISKQDAANYQYIYHALNNYLEGIIPELTGVYGRRGFSSSGGTVTLAESSYDHEVKVFVLVDPLPEIDNCNCIKLEPKKRVDFYDSFGTKTINYIEKKSAANKFKGLYIVAQRRKENGFNLTTIGNNPMNIKGSGDKGQIKMDTHETLNGKYVSVPGESFANFSSEDAGFQGYLDLLDSNYNDAYKSFFDDAKTIDDFTSGLEDTGKKGPYATGRAENGLNGTDAYKAAVKKIFNGAKSDYLKMYECKACKEKDAEKKKKILEDIKLLKKLK